MKADYDHPLSKHEIIETLVLWNISIDKFLDNHQESKKQKTSAI
jgi:hypothetical protein